VLPPLSHLTEGSAAQTWMQPRCYCQTCEPRLQVQQPVDKQSVWQVMSKTRCHSG
jgi:hypothetical protein